jgi:hypothetical protein
VPSLEEAMRQSEDSIEQLDDGLITPVNDVFMINPETRVIEVPESERLFGVNFDKDVEKKYFKCPKIVGNNIDLSKHKIYVVYQKANENITTLMGEVGKYWCEDVKVGETGDYIEFSWLLSGNVLEEQGFIAFKVVAVYTDTETGELKTRWNTVPSVGLVRFTLSDGEEITEQYADVISQLLSRMDAVEDIATPEAMKVYVEQYLNEHPIELDETLTDSKKAAPANLVGQLKEDINEQTGSYLQGKQLFNANDFSIGACTSGLKTESQFRITNAKETFEKSTPIKCKIGDALNINVDLANSDFIGCRVGIHEISNSYFVSDSGWLQVTNKGVSYTVKHKSTIGVNVSFSFSKNSNTVITNSTEYTGELTLDKLLSNIKISVVMGDSVVSNVQLGEMYNNLKKAITMPRMIYKSDPAFDIFLNAESKYRLQGCTVGKEFLYYSMTEQDNSNSYIYKVSLSNGELVSSSAGKYGHAGDMTFNPNTNEIITLTAEISYTDLFILDADTLLLKKTIRVNTEGWRLATIAYNPYTKGYVAEFAKNNTWSEYKFAFTDTNFSIISGFNSIKQGYTLQGIECDGRYVYAMYAYPNIVIVYDVNGSYVGYIKIPFTTESECIAKHNDILFIGEDGEKKIYKVQLQYEWDD